MNAVEIAIKMETDAIKFYKYSLYIFEDNKWNNSRIIK